MIAANKIIGSIVWRTGEALSGNQEFISKLNTEYPYAVELFTNGKFNLWHYPGTFNEIASALLGANKHKKAAQMKFPSLLNFQAIRQQLSGGERIAVFNLAFIGKTNPKWSTSEREAYLFDPLLRPVALEFINQINRSGYFDIAYKGPDYTFYEVFTTGDSKGVLLEKYGDYIDAIELHVLKLTIRDICNKSVIAKIEKENRLVTERFLETIKS